MHNSCGLSCLVAPFHDSSLQTMLLLQLEVLLPQGVHPVDHLLHELHLGVPQPVLVGHVVGATCNSWLIEIFGSFSSLKYNKATFRVYIMGQFYLRFLKNMFIY